jgi:putative heme-binding domain-containing protein
MDGLDTDDPLLKLSLEMSVREHLQQRIADEVLVSGVRPGMLRPEASGEIARLALATKSPEAGGYLVYHIITGGKIGGDLLNMCRHIGATADDGPLNDFLHVAQLSFSGWHEGHAKMALAFVEGLASRGKPTDEKTRHWCQTVAENLLKLDTRDAVPWNNFAVEGLAPSEDPWVLQRRPSADGNQEALFVCSLPKGEQRTGNYHSATFELPPNLSFWCAGHDGFPNVPLQGKNLVRLRDAKTHEVLASSPPPRNDTAQKIEWDLAKHRGQRGYIEIVDGDDGRAFAWLAVGRFSIFPLNPSQRTLNVTAAAELIGKLKIHSLRPRLAKLLVSADTDHGARTAIGQALVSLDPDSRAAALVAALGDPSIGDVQRTRFASAIAGRDTKLLGESLAEAMKVLPLRMQTTLAETLAGDADGAETLVALVKAGVASPRLLTSANVKAKLDAIKNDALNQQVESITANLPAQSELIDKLVLERRAAYPKTNPSLEKGAALFEKHCAACHQIAGKGSVIGPQLDGIGLRGLERLVEDVLDPNRNVDVAFRTTTIRTVDGEVISGLVRREEGATLVLADSKGKEFSVPKSDIEEQAKGSLSLMPANVHEIVSEPEFFDLLTYLLSQKQPPEPGK